VLFPWIGFSTVSVKVVSIARNRINRVREE
jgi:hypothetical protein